MVREVLLWGVGKDIIDEVCIQHYSSLHGAYRIYSRDGGELELLSCFDIFCLTLNGTHLVLIEGKNNRGERIEDPLGIAHTAEEAAKTFYQEIIAQVNIYRTCLAGGDVREGEKIPFYDFSLDGLEGVVCSKDKCSNKEQVS